MENKIERKAKNEVVDENTQRPYYIDPGTFNMEKVLSSDSPIKEFKQINDRNIIYCVLENGKEHIIPVNHSVQLFYDKMEMHPETKVDFGRKIKDKIIIFPFQNKIIYLDGVTGKQKNSLPIDANLVYIKDSEKYIKIDSRLNPAILALLDNYQEVQNDYINATGDIDIIYDFEEKSEKFADNISNQDLAKKMNKYYELEKKYVKASKSRKELSKKVGYVNIFDKIKSLFGKFRNKPTSTNSKQVKSFEEKRANFRKNIRNLDKLPKNQTKYSNHYDRQKSSSEVAINGWDR